MKQMSYGILFILSLGFGFYVLAMEEGTSNPADTRIIFKFYDKNDTLIKTEEHPSYQNLIKAKNPRKELWRVSDLCHRKGYLPARAIIAIKERVNKIEKKIEATSCINNCPIKTINYFLPYWEVSTEDGIAEKWTYSEKAKKDVLVDRCFLKTEQEFIEGSQKLNTDSAESDKEKEIDDSMPIKYFSYIATLARFPQTCVVGEKESTVDADINKLEIGGYDSGTDGFSRVERSAIEIEQKQNYERDNSYVEYDLHAWAQWLQDWHIVNWNFRFNKPQSEVLFSVNWHLTWAGKLVAAAGLSGLTLAGALLVRRFCKLPKYSTYLSKMHFPFKISSRV